MTLTQIESLAKSGKIRGYAIGVGKVAGIEGKRGNAKQVEAIGSKRIKEVLKSKDIAFQVEHVFSKRRKFRFDISVPEYRLAVEYEGLVATGKKGGHQTKTGYASNCTKYNLAALEKWTVLRYTARTYKNFENDLIEFLMRYKTN